MEEREDFRARGRETGKVKGRGSGREATRCIHQEKAGKAGGHEARVRGNRGLHGNRKRSNIWHQAEGEMEIWKGEGVRGKGRRARGERNADVGKSLQRKRAKCEEPKTGGQVVILQGPGAKEMGQGHGGKRQGGRCPANGQAARGR
jgi:hypothetical protein